MLTQKWTPAGEICPHCSQYWNCSPNMHIMIECERFEQIRERRTPELLYRLRELYAATNPERCLLEQPFTNDEILFAMMGCPPPDMWDTPCSRSTLLEGHPAPSKEESAAITRTHKLAQAIVIHAAWTIQLMEDSAHTAVQQPRPTRGRRGQAEWDYQDLE